MFNMDGVEFKNKNIDRGMTGEEKEGGDEEKKNYVRSKYCAIAQRRRAAQGWEKVFWCARSVSSQLG